MGFKAPNVGIAVATTRLGNAEDHKKILKLAKGYFGSKHIHWLFLTPVKNKNTSVQRLVDLTIIH